MVSAPLAACSESGHGGAARPAPAIAPTPAAGWLALFLKARPEISKKWFFVESCAAPTWRWQTLGLSVISKVPSQRQNHRGGLKMMAESMENPFPEDPNPPCSFSMQYIVPTDVQASAKASRDSIGNIGLPGRRPPLLRSQDRGSTSSSVQISEFTARPSNRRARALKKKTEIPYIYTYIYIPDPASVHLFIYIQSKATETADLGWRLDARALADRRDLTRIAKFISSLENILACNSLTKPFVP